MRRITRGLCCWTMSCELAPVLTVAPGEVFVLETEDCYGGRLKRAGDPWTEAMRATVNPATGPVAVNGASPGQVLRVDILNIEIREYAVMCIRRSAGALGQYLGDAETTVHAIRNGHLEAVPGLALPVRPMIGVIGTAPGGSPVPNSTPGEHGGNLDCRMIAAGASVYLPVAAPGALLAVGDLHAAMGDGEVAVCGAEVSGAVTLSAHVLPAGPPTPCEWTRDGWHLLSSAPMMEAARAAVLDKAHRFLTECAGYGAFDAARIMSLAGHLEVCQIVNPQVTLRFSLPEAVTHGRLSFLEDAHSEK